MRFCNVGIREVILLGERQHLGQLTLDTMIPAYADNSVETKLCFAVRFPPLNVCFNDYIMALPGRLPQCQGTESASRETDSSLEINAVPPEKLRSWELGSFLRTNYSFSIFWPYILPNLTVLDRSGDLGWVQDLCPQRDSKFHTPGKVHSSKSLPIPGKETTLIPCCYLIATSIVWKPLTITPALTTQ